ncbi:15340_t:CDS:1, partial [Gigaspora margarita]
NSKVWLLTYELPPNTKITIEDLKKWDEYFVKKASSIKSLLFTYLAHVKSNADRSKLIMGIPFFNELVTNLKADDFKYGGNKCQANLFGADKIDDILTEFQYFPFHFHTNVGKKEHQMEASLEAERQRSLNIDEELKLVWETLI